MKLLFSLNLIAGMAITMFAQDPAAPAGSPVALPPGPLVKPIPPQTRWTIIRKGGHAESPEPAKTGDAGETKSGQKESGAGQFDMQIIGEKVGDISHIVTTYGNGNRREVWRNGNVQTTMNTGWKQPNVGPAYDEAEDINWTSASNFTGIKKVSGLDCMIFRDRILPELYRARPDLLKKSVASSEVEQKNMDLITKVLGTESSAIDPESVKIDAAAVIDLERRLPMSLLVGKVVTTYKYELLPPTYTVDLPADIKTAIDARGEQIKANTRKPARP